MPLPGTLSPPWAMSCDFGALPESGFVLEGAAVTLGLTAVCVAAGHGARHCRSACAFRSKRLWIRRAVAGYVELIRNTPFIVQLFFLFFGLPSVGLRLSALQAAALAMTINLTAYAIEMSAPASKRCRQGNARLAALGLRPLLVFVFIVLPQALANVYPAWSGQITITMLESAVVLADRGGRPDPCRRLHSVAQFSLLRNLSGDHPDLSGAGGADAPHAGACRAPASRDARDDRLHPVGSGAQPAAGSALDPAAVGHRLRRRRHRRASSCCSSALAATNGGALR